MRSRLRRRKKVRGRPWHKRQGTHTSCLVSEVDGSTIVRSASYVAHAASRADAPPAPNDRVKRLRILSFGLAVYVECDGRTTRVRGLWLLCIYGWDADEMAI